MIKIQDLKKSYSDVTAISHINLEIESGERLAVLGPSGSGKTTLLRMIAGFDWPDEGTILIEGKTASETGRILLPPYLRSIGMVFQEPALWPHLTVRGNIKFAMKSSRSNPKILKDKMEKIFKDVHITHLANAYPSEISGGEQQRVALGRAIASEPKYLLMDEPLSNLDPMLRKEIINLIDETANKLQLTLIYVTHRPEEARLIGKRIIILSNGRIVKEIDPSVLPEYPEFDFRKLYSEK